MTRQFKPGDRVRLRVLPTWVEALPAESQAVFRFCVGRIYPIEEITSDGLLVLDVHRDIDRLFGGVYNDIRVEPEWVESA